MKRYQIAIYIRISKEDDKERCESNSITMQRILLRKFVARHVFDKVQEGRGLNPYFTCHNRYSNAMENCVDNVNAMFLERYVLFMMQDKLQADGELEKLRREAVTRLDREIKFSIG